MSSFGKYVLDRTDDIFSIPTALEFCFPPGSGHYRPSPSQLGSGIRAIATRSLSRLHAHGVTVMACPTLPRHRTSSRSTPGPLTTRTHMAVQQLDFSRRYALASFNSGPMELEHAIPQSVPAGNPQSLLRRHHPTAASHLAANSSQSIVPRPADITMAGLTTRRYNVDARLIITGR